MGEEGGAGAGRRAEFVNASRERVAVYAVEEHGGRALVERLEPGESVTLRVTGARPWEVRAEEAWEPGRLLHTFTPAAGRDQRVTVGPGGVRVTDL